MNALYTFFIAKYGPKKVTKIGHFGGELMLATKLN